MGNLHRRDDLDDDARHRAPRQTGPASDLPARWDARPGRDGSDGLGPLSASRPMTTHVAQGALTALLVSGRSEQKELGALLQGRGFHTLMVDSADRPPVMRDPVALCLIDLRENGEAIRSARTLRTQYPQSVLIGVADPARPSAAAEAIRAGVFDV